MLKAIIVATTALTLATSAAAEGDPLSGDPMREWVSWIKQVRPTRDHYRGPESRLTTEQWIVERAYLVLFRLGQQCESDGYAIKNDPFDLAVTRLTGSGWAGATMIPGHADQERGQRILYAVDAAYEHHGRALCAAFNFRLGRNGDLVAPLRRFTAGNKPPHRYTDIVMWSDAEICRHPEKFWENDWMEPRARPVVEQLRDESCKRSRR